MRLHRPLDEVYSPLHADAQHPVERSYCDADGAAHDPRYGIRGMLAYRSTLLGIKLQHAPVVRFRYVGIDPVNGDIDSKHSLNLGEVWGMCLAPNSCTEGYGRGTTYYADLFAVQAPLTDEQMLAEDAIMAMTTEEFWGQAARENGITDMATVEEARKRAIFDLNGEFLDADFQI